MFERISRSFELARSSWQVLRTDKKLIVFPVISGLGCLLVLITFAVPLALLVNWNQFQNNQGNVQPPWWSYVVAFAFYFCTYFVVIFCNAALVSCALLRFGGETPTVSDGFQMAANRLPQIAAWALVSATVGLLLKIIENAHERVGQIVSALLGTAWTVITYFVVPVLVVEQVSPFQAISRSLQILRKTWGEALIGHLGLGFFKLLLFLPVLAVLVLGGLALTTAPMLGFALLALGAVGVLVWLAVGSALDGIFLSALYQYAAHGQVPMGFDADMLEHAFRSRQ